MTPPTLEECAARYQRAATAQARNDAAETALRACADLLRQRAARHAGGLFDRDELEQVARCGLLDALRTYKPDKGARFETFARRVIDCDLSNFAGADRAERRARSGAALDEARDIAPPETCVRTHGSGVPLKLTRGRLEVLRLAWDGLTMPEQAQALGISVEAVKDRWEELHSQARRHGLHRTTLIFRWALRAGLIER